jgi:hypothetical protein
MRLRRMLPLCLTAAASLLCSCSSTEFRPPVPMGPPVLVRDGDAPCLWWLSKQEESRPIYSGPGSDTLTRKTFYHFDLQCHDTQTTARRWKARLLTLKNEDGGNSAEARLLGQDGSIVWMFLQNQPVALSSHDGTSVATWATLVQRNPSLHDLLPKELKFYAFDQGLVITTADAHRCRVRAADFICQPYAPASEEQFAQLQFYSTVWNGAFNTADFETRMATLGGQWLGLYTAKEAADVGNDEFGRRLTDTYPIVNEGSQARRTLWTARIGKTRPFPEGTHDRLFDVTPIAGAGEYLNSGFLIKQGTKQPLVLTEPTGLLILSHTRVDAEGRLAVTRLDDTRRDVWRASLPTQELTNRFEFPDRLLLWGRVQVTEKAATDWQEFVISLDLRTGHTNAWNATLQQQMPPTQVAEAETPASR